jgi:hypothetical protein
MSEPDLEDWAGLEAWRLPIENSQEYPTSAALNPDPETAIWYPPIAAADDTLMSSQCGLNVKNKGEDCCFTVAAAETRTKINNVIPTASDIRILALSRDPDPCCRISVATVEL